MNCFSLSTVRSAVKMASAFVVMMLFGSMALAEDTTYVQQGSWLPRGCTVIEGDILIEEARLHVAAAASYKSTDLWDNQRVPYAFNPTQNISSAKRQLMQNAMAVWQGAANVVFVLRTNESNYVRIDSSDEVNNSFVGQVGGQQVINIHDWDDRGVLAHELGHCLGFWHEHSRPDRDSYVRINWDAIVSGEDHNFDKDHDASVYGPYDLLSIMHYSQCAFSECSLGPFSIPPCTCQMTIGGQTIQWNGATITALPPYQDYQLVMGTGDSPSHLDSLTMSFLYPHSSWRFIDNSNTGLAKGTFLEPYIAMNPTIATYLLPTNSVVWIQPGTYSSRGTYSKPMTLRAPLGGVTLGS